MSVGTHSFLGVFNLDQPTTGLSGVNDEIVLQADAVMEADTFELSSVAGAMTVDVSRDSGNTWLTDIALIDQHATNNNPVTATVAGQVYGFGGMFTNVRVQQDGGTAVTGARLSWGKRLRR